MKRGAMKKIIIIGLSLFLGTQAFAFGMNTTGSASVEENHIQGEFEVNIPHRDCVATLEYAPVCARIQGEEAKTFSNGGHAKCAGASIIHAGPCDHGKEKDENHEKAHVGFGMNFAGKGMMAKHVQGVNAKAGLKFNKKQGLKLHSVINRYLNTPLQIWLQQYPLKLNFVDNRHFLIPHCLKLNNFPD